MPAFSDSTRGDCGITDHLVGLGQHILGNACSFAADDKCQSARSQIGIRNCDALMRRRGQHAHSASP